MTKKYTFTGKTKGKLYQIQRISDSVVGGWIESEKNLSLILVMLGSMMML